MSRTYRRPLEVVRESRDSYSSNTLASSYHDKEWYENYYDRFGRDGNLWYRGYRKDYKEMCKKDVRRRNRNLCHQIMLGKYDDSLAYPSYKETKRFIWCIW